MNPRALSVYFSNSISHLASARIGTVLGCPPFQHRHRPALIWVNISPPQVGASRSWAGRTALEPRRDGLLGCLAGGVARRFGKLGPLGGKEARIAELHDALDRIDHDEGLGLVDTVAAAALLQDGAPVEAAVGECQIG